jgi:hypothetical protein
MNEAGKSGTRYSITPKAESTLLEQYGCGPIRFSGADDGLYERHLLFDDVIAPANAGPHERYRAVACSVRDVLSQRWVRTETTYDSENPKRVYYLATNTASLSNQFATAGSSKSRIIGCLTTTPGRCVGRTRKSKSSSTVRLP